MTSDAIGPPFNSRDVTAGGITVQVVAVRLPGHWIIRAIGTFKGYERLREWIIPYVALAPAEQLEWTHHEYRVPWYLAYDNGDIEGTGWIKSGVYVFRHATHTWRADEHGECCTYGDAEMLRNDVGPIPARTNA